MLAVHGQKRLPGLARGFRHQRAACDERFLVGQQHALARAERVHHGGQPCEPHDRNEHVVRFGKRSRGFQTFRAENPVDVLQESSGMLSGSRTSPHMRG